MCFRLSNRELQTHRKRVNGVYQFVNLMVAIIVLFPRVFPMNAVMTDSQNVSTLIFKKGVLNEERRVCRPPSFFEAAIA